MIQQRAMLATLNISAWTARKQDKKVSAEVESAHGAHDAGRYNKLLVSKALLDPIAKLTGQVREYHYSRTLPWADSGARLLPTKLFMEYSAQIRKFREQFAGLVKHLQDQYPSEVQAARVRLGTMYQPEDYPDVSTIKDKFGINLELMPVPDAADFRVDVSRETQDELRESVTNAVAGRQAAAIKATFERVRDVVGKIAERLGDEKAIFKDSLIDNASELCIVLDALNITNDPLITEVQRAIENKLIVSPTQLRNTITFRRHVAQSAREILAMLP